MRMIAPMAFLLTNLVALVPASAVPLEYEIKFDGFSDSGHRLGVTGTITADPATNQFVTSNLLVTHDDTSVALPAFPDFADPSLFHWIMTADALWIMSDQHRDFANLVRWTTATPIDFIPPRTIH